MGAEEGTGLKEAAQGPLCDGEEGLAFLGGGRDVGELEGDEEVAEDEELGLYENSI